MPGAVLLLVVALLPIVAARADAQPSILRVGVPSVPSILDPATALEGSVPLLARQVYETLVQYREGSSDVEPGLAVQWSVARDGLSWSFRLREGVRFQDGTPLTAHHVVDSLERLVVPGHAFTPTPNLAGPRLLRGTPGVIKEVRALDPRTVLVGLHLPYAPLLTVLAHPAFSIVLPAPSGGAARFIGTGPFAVSSVVPGQAVLDASWTWWGGAPRVGRLAFLEAADEGRAVAALDAGELDVLIPAGAPPRLERALSVPGWRMGYLALQTEKEPLRRLKVRRAVAAALGPTVLAPALGSTAVPLLSFLPPGVWGRRDGPPVLEGTPGAARRLLAEAGYPNGLPVTLLAPDVPAPLDLAGLAEALRAALAEAGFTVTVKVEPSEAALGLARRGEHEIALLEARVEGGDPHFLLYPLSTSEGAARGPGATNLSFFRSARVDDLLIRASQLSFRPERQRLYLRAQAALAEEVPWVPLYAHLHWALVRPEVRGLRLHPSGHHRLDRVWLETAAPPLVPGWR